MSRKFTLCLLILAASFCFSTMSRAQQQTDQQDQAQEKFVQEGIIQQQQLQQQIAQQQMIQQQQLEFQQMDQQRLEQLSAGSDLYLFNGYYDRDRDAYHYGHRGFESRGLAHSDGRRGGRR